MDVQKYNNCRALMLVSNKSRTIQREPYQAQIFARLFIFEKPDVVSFGLQAKIAVDLYERKQY